MSYFISFKLDKKNIRLKKIVSISIIFSMVLLIISIMQPKWGRGKESIKVNNYNIAIVLDLSNSMNAEDIKPSRLQRTKLEIERFINEKDNIIVSLIGFAGSSFIASPLTQDFETYSIILNSLTSKSVTLQGTSIATALMTAIKSFPDTYSLPRSIIVITDGEDHTGGFGDVIKELKDSNISLYAVTIGDESGGYIPDHDNNSYKKDTMGNVVLSKRNDKILDSLTKETKGKLYVSKDALIPFDTILKEIEDNGYVSLTKDVMSYKTRFQIFLLPATILLLIVATLMSLVTKTKSKQ